MNRYSHAHGSWLMASGSWHLAHGTWLVVLCAALVLLVTSSSALAQRRGGGPPAAAPGEIANFALVQTVGCLVENAPGRWQLTKATEFVATKDVPAPEADLTAAASAAAGMLTLRLVSVLPFKPESARGSRVLLKGILNRYPGEDPLLNVTQLQPVGACAPGADRGGL